MSADEGPGALSLSGGVKVSIRGGGGVTVALSGGSNSVWWCIVSININGGVNYVLVSIFGGDIII